MVVDMGDAKLFVKSEVGAVTEMRPKWQFMYPLVGAQL